MMPLYMRRQILVPLVNHFIIHEEYMRNYDIPQFIKPTVFVLQCKLLCAKAGKIKTGWCVGLKNNQCLFTQENPRINRQIRTYSTSKFDTYVLYKLMAYVLFTAVGVQ